MKHFFDQSTVLDATAVSQLLETARQELKKTPMNLSEMSTKMNLVCFNASAVTQYVPKGMDSLIATQNMSMDQKVSSSFSSELGKMVINSTGDILGYVLDNIQTKNIHNYFDIVFDLKRQFQYDPLVLAHFSYQDLVDYLSDFLKAATVDGIERKVDIYDDKNPASWKTLEKGRDLENVDTGVKEPIVLDRPFFSDISLKIVKNDQTKVVKSAFAQLKSVLGHFNRFRPPSGELVLSKNKLFIKWKDIDCFKLGSIQSKSLLGVSYKGEYIATSQFVTHDLIALKLLKIDDIDHFKIRIGKKQVDIKPEEITHIEVNIDTQQVVLTRGIGKNDFHVGRFNKFKFHKGDKTALIHKVVPFNRGASNFEQIQTFFGTRYTECEKARSLQTARGEFGLLGARSITAGDLISHLVLSSMKLLGYLPFETYCIGFDPEEVKNPQKMTRILQDWFDDLRKLFQRIVDVSQTPSFTEHNFSRLTKSMQAFIKLKNISDTTPESFEKLISELEELTQYMDDFFKLNIYSQLQENLECETVPELDDAPPGEQQEFPDEEALRLDESAKSFISENYSFFEKRGLIQSGLIKIEKMLFYNKHIKAFAEDLKFEPDLIVYADAESQFKNYTYAAYPAIAISSVLDTKILKSKDEDEELFFVKFMREFTRKTHQKALELNKTFHHQFKHTLAELTFIADEKLNQLKDELIFLETPENREEAYKLLFEKITVLYRQQLEAKRQNIIDLGQELAEVEKKLEEYRHELEKLLDASVKPEELETLLESMPDRLEKMKLDIVQVHKEKLAEISPVFNAYAKLQTSAVQYFEKILKYADLFLKALWVHRNQQMFQKAKADSASLFAMEAEETADKIREMEAYQYDESRENSIQKEIDKLTQKLKAVLADLNKIPAKGLYQSKNKEKENLRKYLDYYKSDTEKLSKLVKQLQPIYQQLSNLQNVLFKKQEELVSHKIEKARNDLILKIARMISKDPNCKDEIDQLQHQLERVPKEIKDELGNLRTRLVNAVTKFKSATSKQTISSILKYDEILAQSDRRDQLNDVSKELVNFNQGKKAIEQEKASEIEDLKYLEKQEENLEDVAMSKTLPSTRILLKTQYIPLVEKEKKMLVRANQFLSEIISNEKAIRKALVSTFFKKRYGLPQFANGGFCLDISKGTKDHTERNIYSAFMLMAERFPKACANAQGKVDKIGLKKLEIKGIEGLKSRISQIWQGHSGEQFLFLPSSLILNEAIELCEYKELIAKNNPKAQHSRHSLILIYVRKFSYEAIKKDPALLERYNLAILSNIFINVDGQQIFNNRESIFDACIRETFGNCSDALSDQIAQNFLYI
ncbi:MAG: hypothetical protein GY866_37475 [Proteobacteria bacterium]|nr:hypothetical protein [Pseudomonadota bacterium]